MQEAAVVVPMRRNPGRSSRTDKKYIDPDSDVDDDDGDNSTDADAGDDSEDSDSDAGDESRRHRARRE